MFGQRRYMDLHERDVFAFIFGRTAMFNKQWEAIPNRHFLYGIVSRDGRYIATPVDMSNNKLFESLRHLEAKGLIKIRRTDGGTNEYRICAEAELNTDAIENYMEKHQPSVLKSTFGKLHKLRKTRLNPQSPPTPIQHHPPSCIDNQHNLPILKKPIIKVSRQSGATDIQVPVRIRKISIKSKT